MTVTITTDASYDPTMKIGGYAFWISSDLGYVKYSGVFSKKLLDHNDAELKAIGNAVYFLVQSDRFKKVNRLIINTDSRFCMHQMKISKVTKYSDTRNQIKALLKKRRFRFELRHVKAHTNGSNSRRYVNNWCDRASRMEMRTERRKLKMLSNKVSL